MTDYIHILPTINLSKATPPPTADAHDDARLPALKKSCSPSALPAHTFAKLISGANDFLASRRDAKAHLERDEARRLDERKQILGLRMKNVRPLPFCSLSLSFISFAFAILGKKPASPFACRP